MLPAKLNKTSLALALLPLFLVLPGCGLSDVTQEACLIGQDSIHCMQEAAVEAGDPAKCDSITQREDFKALGSNPPRDKCVVMVAANNEDPSVCKDIKGGPMSYTGADCTKAIADTARNPDTCGKLGGDQGTCANNVAQNVFDDVAKLQKMTNPRTQDIKEVQDNLAKMQKMNEMLTNINKANLDANMAVIRNFRQ